MTIRLFKWGKQKKRSKSRRTGSRQPKPLINNGIRGANVFKYFSLIILFLISKEVFSYDEEFIILLCLFVVFFTFVEGFNIKTRAYFDANIETLLNYYIERFLFTKWGLNKLRHHALFVIFNQLELFFINNYIMLRFFETYVYNYFLRKIYIILAFKELLLLKYILEITTHKKNFLKVV